MLFLRTISGAIVGAIMILLISWAIPITPDLSDWGGKAFPCEYLTPLLILTLISYFSAWVGAKFSPRTGRLVGMLAAILAGVVALGWDTRIALFKPLFHHPAYPVFSDHTLLALAMLLVAGHLGGLRVEKGYLMHFIDKSPELSPPRESVS
jgi:hypothetical protein